MKKTPPIHNFDKGFRKPECGNSSHLVVFANPRQLSHFTDVQVNGQSHDQRTQWEPKSATHTKPFTLPLYILIQEDFCDK